MVEGLWDASLRFLAENGLAPKNFALVAAPPARAPHSQAAAADHEPPATAPLSPSSMHMHSANATLADRDREEWDNEALSSFDLSELRYSELTGGPVFFFISRSVNVLDLAMMDHIISR